MHYPPYGYTIRHEENAGTMFYRAVRTSGTEWQSPLLRATYEVALRDAEAQALRRATESTS